MDFLEYENAAARTINPNLDASGRLIDAAAGLAEEAGEALSLVRKHLYQSSELDRAKLEKELGWRAQESFETGLRKTVEWYLANAAWVEGVTSGAYQQWVRQNYGGREATASADRVEERRAIGTGEVSR